MDMDDDSVQNLDLIQLNMSAWEFSNRGFMGKSRGGSESGPPPPHENYKNIRFHSNTGPDPLKTTKLPSHDRYVIQQPKRVKFTNCSIFLPHNFFGLDFHFYVLFLLIGIGQLDNDI